MRSAGTPTVPPPPAYVEAGFSRTLQLAAILLLLSAPSTAQSVSQRGFVEGRGTLYPQDAPNDPTNAVANFLFRQEASWRSAAWLTFAGAFDARMDTHGRVAREWRVDWADRGLLRPALAVRRLDAAARFRGVTVEAGKQFVRWGKADVLNPTDRFAPRDFMEVFTSEFLGITAARVTWERGEDTVDAVFARFTPSRVPVATDRWAALPGRLTAAGLDPAAVAIRDLGAVYPDRPQLGARWNHVASGIEFSLSAFDGFNHLPSYETSIDGSPPSLPSGVGQGSRLRAERFGEARRSVAEAAGLALQFLRTYPRMRMLGGDAAIPTRWVTLKGEAAYFTSPDGQADEYGIYVVQAERQAGEWFFVAGYAGEVTGKRRAQAAGSLTLAFALDRGVADSFLGRASCTIDVNRSLAFEGAVKQDAAGAWLKAEYSQAVGQHLRVTATGNLIRGDETDFLGQYRLNSNVELVLRYSY